MNAEKYTPFSADYYCDVSAEFAAAEGEELGIEPTEDMLLVLERFKVVYQ